MANRKENDPERSESPEPSGGKLPGTVDPIEQTTGAFGKYQLIVSLVLFLSKFFVAFHQLSIIFMGPKIKFTCGETGVQQCPCSDPKYDRSIFSNTIIMKWNLICESQWLSNLSQTLFQFGVLLGSVTYGMAADRYGRRNPLLVAVVIEILVGVAAAYVPRYWMFAFLRFILGWAVGGTMVTTFVIMMECLGAKHREFGSAIYHLPFNLGHMMVPGFAYFIRDYSDLQLAFSVPALCMLCYFFLPESPRWLIAVNRTEEAIKVLECAAKMNKMPTENIRTIVINHQAKLSANQLKKGTIVDLFRTPNIRRNTICMAINWLTCSYCFYGVSQFMGHLSGNVFFNVSISATVTALGTLVSIPLLKVVGRKVLVIGFNSLSAFCLILLAFVRHEVGSVVLASIGVVSSFIVFVVVYLHCSELFPTVVRNAALGLSSMAARIGSMVAPFVIDLYQIATWMPPIIFAMLPIISCFTCLLLPETKGCKLMTTIEEGENYTSKRNVKINEERGNDKGLTIKNK